MPGTPPSSRGLASTVTIACSLTVIVPSEEADRSLATVTPNSTEAGVQLTNPSQFAPSGASK